ncbi:hypothetical protein BpHYR1_046902 [Brachionus plicatilis]|uniref:Uncharacterized protein n=1 Tax=Brachionus plicatilis TaxID=10195 RepID=A0A3M7QCG0_BRAPC|nr:hypothetical protein BpHYR1_046902 [Brachionus plicatilis]
MLLRSKKLTSEYLKAINHDNSLNDAEPIDKPQEQDVTNAKIVDKIVGFEYFNSEAQKIGAEN